MMETFILPDMQRRSGQTAVIRSRTLRTWGDSESGLAEKLADRIDQLDSIGNPTLAFLASGIEGIKVRVTAKSEDEETAAQNPRFRRAVFAQSLGRYHLRHRRGDDGDGRPA